MSRIVSSGKKTRMDVLSSDLYIDHQSSDDSLPDLATAFGIKSTYNQPDKPTNWARQTGPSSTETLTRNNRPQQDNNSDTLARIRQMMAKHNSPPPQLQRNPSNGTGTANRAQSHTQFNFDHISSSSPTSAARPPTNRAKSFNSAGPIPSGSPLVSNPPARAPIHRASTFPSAESFNPLPIYHEISDEDDEDLKAAIAASLADMDTQPMYVAPRTSVFQDPTELWDSPPRAAATQVVTPTIRVPSKTPNLTVRQPSPKPSEPPSSQTLSRVRDDTRRLLSALDDLTTNHLKRKNEETPPPPNKTSTTTQKPTAKENLDQPKPKRGRLTQEQKVLPHPHMTNNPRTRAQQPKQKKPPPKNPNVSKKSSPLQEPDL